jgi:hypothetical protein
MRNILFVDRSAIVPKYHPDHVQNPRASLGFGKEERSMFRMVAAVLLTTSLCVDAASARGGGGAEPMPGVNFTDMPPYLSGPPRSVEQVKPVRRHVRWRRGSERDR